MALRWRRAYPGIGANPSAERLGKPTLRNAETGGVFNVNYYSKWER
jgi:hypothetical protein